MRITRFLSIILHPIFIPIIAFMITLYVAPKIKTEMRNLDQANKILKADGLDQLGRGGGFTNPKPEGEATPAKTPDTAEPTVVEEIPVPVPVEHHRASPRFTGRQYQHTS